jgi:hypothetical protein
MFEEKSQEQEKTDVAKVRTETTPRVATMRDTLFRQECLAIGLSASEVAHILKDESEGIS